MIPVPASEIANGAKYKKGPAKLCFQNLAFQAATFCYYRFTYCWRYFAEDLLSQFLEKLMLAPKLDAETNGVIVAECQFEL